MNILSLTFSNSKNVATVKGTTFRQAAPNNYNEIPAHDEFVRSTGSLDIARLKNLGISHFRLIDSDSVRGVTLANQDPALLTELKECGINTIIDLNNTISDMKIISNTYSASELKSKMTRKYYFDNRLLLLKYYLVRHPDYIFHLLQLHSFLIFL